MGDHGAITMRSKDGNTITLGSIPSILKMEVRMKHHSTILVKL